MDNVAHTLVGAAVARSGFAERLGAKRATWTGVIAANAPDLDILQLLWASRTDYIFEHRGITHSYLGWVAGSALLALALKAVWRDAALRPLLALCALCWGSNLALDVITSWGTMLALPFTDERFAFNWVFIVDLVCVALVAAPWLLRRWIAERTIFRASHFALAVYLVGCAVAHTSAEASLEMLARAEGVEVEETYPAPFAPFLWNGVAVDGERAYQADMTMPWVPGSFAHSQPHNRNHPAVKAFSATEEGVRFHAWARSPVARVVDLEGGRVRLELRDLRFESGLARRVGRKSFEYHVELAPDRERGWRVVSGGAFVK